MYNDEGRSGHPPAYVDVGQPVLFGFEWGMSTVEELQVYVDNPDHDMRLSVNGGTPFSVKDGYQPAFMPTPGSGPRRMWDHDGDGIGDGDGDGIDDWNTATLFFRYQSYGLPAGTHTLMITAPDLVPITQAITLTENQNLSVTLPKMTVPPNCDVNNDGTVGLEEAIHVLQIVSGVRSNP